LLESPSAMASKDTVMDALNTAYAWLSTTTPSGAPSPLPLLVLAALVLFGFLSLLFNILLPAFSPLRKLPHPPSPSWIWGNMRQIFEAPSGVLHADWEKEYGQVYAYRQFLSAWRLTTTDPRALGHILQHAYAYPKPPQVRRNVARGFGEGLLVAEGDIHKRQRRIMNPSFSAQQIRELTPIFWDKSEEMTNIWVRMLDEAGGDNVEIDVTKWMSRATLDIIGLAGFGYPFESLTNEDNELARAFSAMLSRQRPTTLALIGNVIPGFRYLTGGNRATDMAMATMRRIGLELVRGKKDAVMRTMDGKREEKDIGRSQVAGRDLLTALVRANMANDVPASQKMDDNETLAQISTFLIAGHETTSSAVTWSLFALSTNKDVQKKLRDELLSYTSPRPNMDELNAIPYLDMFVREVLRFHAPVSGTIRMADEDDEIPVERAYRDVDGTLRTSIRIKKGDGVFIPIKTVNRNTVLWGPDANLFRPERWETVPEAAARIPGVWAHLMTFLAGPRACIGYRFSIIEIKVFLFVLLRQFTFEFADPTMEFEERQMIVTRPVIKGRAKEGQTLPLRLRRVVQEGS